MVLSQEQTKTLFEDLTNLTSHGDYDPPFKLSVLGNKVTVTSIPGFYNNFSNEEDDATPFYVLDEFEAVEDIFANSIEALGAEDFEDLVGNILESPSDIYSIEFETTDPKAVEELAKEYPNTFRDLEY